MGHTYASLDEFKAFLVSNGGTDYGTTEDVPMLLNLTAASERIDDFCDRSQFGSGFGPRIGTNEYDTAGGGVLDFYDDLLTASGVTVREVTGGTDVILAADTDYYLEPYGGPYRRIRLNTLGWPALGSGRKVAAITGTWGYASELALSLTTVSSGLATDAAAVTFTTSAAPLIEVGQTLRIGSEDLSLSALSGTTATVIRGVNGTTAAVHANASPISVHRYPAKVVMGTLLVAQRRWRMREAGLTGDFSTGGGAVGQKDSEISLLFATVGRLRATFEEDI